MAKYEHGRYVEFTDHQAELDRVMGEAVKFAEIVHCSVLANSPRWWQADAFLTSHEVHAWRERQKETS